MKLILFAVAMLLSATAQAEVYKCVENGKQVFSDQPCAKDAQKLNVKPASGDGDESRAWAQRLIALRRVDIGMTDKEVIRAWGRPDHINPTSSVYGYREQWVYERSNYRSQYLHFENGVLTSASF